MGRVKSFSLWVIVIAVLFRVFVHQPLPSDTEDFYLSQIFTDFLYFSDAVGKVLTVFGISSWKAFYGMEAVADYATAIPSSPSLRFEFVDLAGVRSVVVRPKHAEGDIPAIVFYHGGGWTIGNIDAYQDLLSDMAESTGYVVMSPDYRLAPEHPFPAAYEDCLRSTLEFVGSRRKEFGVDPERVVLAGDSAGGNLALALTNGLIKNTGVFTPVMQALVYPATQMINFKLDSYNNQYFLPTLLMYKFYLSYTGFDDRQHQAALLSNNDHVDTDDVAIATAIDDLINNRVINEKYKLKQKEGGDVLHHGLEKDADMQKRMKELVLDPRLAPLMEDSEVLKRAPRTHFYICGYDQLRDDGFLMANRLEELGVDVSVQYLPRSVHGSLTIGSIAALKPSYHSEQNEKLFATIKNYVDQL